ncbi:MAG: ompA-family exported protein [Polyangiaceae bacterium]|jgi:peptidoglycan-associated lipoprotein|nr:ompA-family exported protein [Polyangiaceae bacterium]
MKRALSILALGTALGCGSDPPPPAKVAEVPPPATQPAPPPVANNPKPDDDPSKGNINISDEIKKACGISDAEAYFGYDSANIRPQDKAVLKKLATCFTTGPLKGREMRLVGHADNRGEEDYNMLLGQKRADNVKTAIVTEGMTAAKTLTTSRGELDATGADEATWAKDRRVDIVLGS